MRSSLEGLDADLVVRRNDGFTLDIALHIRPGSTAVLLGPNGAGKSTAASALAGLTPISEGRIVLNGRVLDDPNSDILVRPEDRRVGVVFQDPMLFPHMSVKDNVAFGLQSRGVRRRMADDSARDWLEGMGLADLGERNATKLSGGQAQLVALARALAIDPDLLVLDEPLSALDVTTRVETRRALTRYLSEFAGPRLVITHDPAEAFLLGDEVLILEHGSLSQVGSPEDIRRRPRTRYAADLAGINLLTGIAARGVVTTAGGHELHVADYQMAGPALATIHPRAVMLFSEPPSGSARNVWSTRVVALEPSMDRTRVVLDRPPAFAAEVTDAAVREMSLRVGGEVWVAVKATEIEVSPG